MSEKYEHTLADKFELFSLLPSQRYVELVTVLNV